MKMLVPVVDTEGQIQLVPMKVLPARRQFFLLCVTEHHKFSIEEGKFIPTEATGSLELHKSERVDTLQSLKGKNLADIVNQAVQILKKEYLRLI